MRSTKFFLPVLFTLLAFSSSNAQNVNGRISSSIYAFERASSLTESDMFLRAYETLVLNVNKNNYSLRTRMNFENNFREAGKNDPKFRLYNLYFEARKVFDVATIKLGRQPVFNQVAGGLFDGANLKLNMYNVTVQGYIGGNVPAYQKFEITDDWQTNRIFGGKISYNGLKDFRFGLSYVDKNYTPLEYETQRLDVNLNPITVLIQQNSNQYKFGSATLSYIGLLDIHARVNYDFNFEELSKAEFSGRYAQIENLGINLYYNYRAPQIRYNSIFAVFDFGNTHEIEGGLDYKINNDFTVYGKFGNVEYKDENSQRITLGMNTSYGSLNFRNTLGYAGELTSVSLYTSKSLYEGKFTPSVGLAYTNYKLTEDDDANDIISLLAGVNIRPWRTLSFDVQGQYSDNKIYKNDLRLFLKINYWFNTNLDLL
jgi:hypothetical protein